MRLNPAWQQKVMREIEEDEFKFVLTGSLETKWLVSVLVVRGKPFALINEGAGVKTITSATCTCSMCGGRGKI